MLQKWKSDKKWPDRETPKVKMTTLITMVGVSIGPICVATSHLNCRRSSSAAEAGPDCNGELRVSRPWWAGDDGEAK